jgi:hypothetical protein
MKSRVVRDALEPCALRGARTVLRGPGSREAPPATRQFCMSRSVRLQLSSWRLALHLRPAIPVAYAHGEDEPKPSSSGGRDETTPMEMPSPDD